MELTPSKTKMILVDNNMHIYQYFLIKYYINNKYFAIDN